MPQVSRAEPPRAWTNPATQWQVVLTDPWYSHLARIQHEVQAESHRFFWDQGLLSAAVPLTTSGVSSPMGLGSDSLPVQVELFGIPTYLADSMQFMLELCCRINQNGFYYIMTSFRGEPTDASHLAQFYHIEAEIPGDLEAAMLLAGELLDSITRSLAENCEHDIYAMAGGVEHLDEVIKYGGEYPVFTIDDALEILGHNSQYVVSHGRGAFTLNRSGEREFLRRVDKAIAWITHFDAITVPFYQAIDPSSPSKALNADLILDGRETIGAGQRHRTDDEVLSALNSHAHLVEPYDWYIAMKRQWPVLTSGFGLGMERLISWVVQHDDIRDLTMIYRENGVPSIP